MNKKILGWSLVILILVGGVFYGARAWIQARQQVALSEEIESIPSPVINATSPTPRQSNSPTSLPNVQAVSPSPVTTQVAQVNHNVPFTSQAPYGTWDEVAKEACEEASILMASWFVKGRMGNNQSGYTNRVEPDTANAEIQELVAWQKETFGYWEDTNTEETFRMMKEKLGVTNARLMTSVTSEAIKSELAAGNILVVPAAGQLLNNPNFKQPGPPYHMLVIRGYNEKGFITNDPGTRQGEGFIYSEENLLDAIHDWTGSDNTVQTGKKVAIVVGK